MTYQEVMNINPNEYDFIDDISKIDETAQVQMDFNFAQELAKGETPPFTTTNNAMDLLSIIMSLASLIFVLKIGMGGITKLEF